MLNRFICPGCKKPVLPGEPHWTARLPAEDWHWKCAEIAGLVGVTVRGITEKAPPHNPTR